MLTWAIVYFCTKLKGNPGYLLITAMAMDTWVLIEFARAL
jgi:hypothetical protein